MTKVICGVDVSSQTVHARIGSDGPDQVFSNSSQGLAALADFCRSHQVELVAMEATGGFEQLPFALLWEQGLPTAILNPRAVRRFAEGMGLLEKTDRIDAGVIAWYAATRRIVAAAPPSQAQRQLKALVTRLRQLTELQTMQRNQRRLVNDPAVQEGFQQMLILIRTQIRDLEIAITALIAADPLWQTLDEAFRSLKGVADRTVARIMAELPEIGTLSNKAISKLAGLAPIARDSGKAQGRRRVRGGRSGVRAILFVVADLVRRYDPHFAAFHRRLTQAGKPKKVIRIALAHKLLVQLNARARDLRQQFQSNSGIQKDLLPC